MDIGSRGGRTSDASKPTKGDAYFHNFTSRLKKFGLSEEAYVALFESQNGKCRICGMAQSDRALAIDHDHVTGRVRGLLCLSCNTGLGHFRDSAKLLAAAIEYLS